VLDLEGGLSGGCDAFGSTSGPLKPSATAPTTPIHGFPETTNLNLSGTQDVVKLRNILLNINMNLANSAFTRENP